MARVRSAGAAPGAAGLLSDGRRLATGARNGGEVAAHRRGVGDGRRRRGDGGRDEVVAAARPAAVRATRLGQRRSARRLSGGGVTRSGNGRRERGCRGGAARSGEREVCYRDTRRVAATRQRCAAVRARRGVTTADRWGLLSVISELKITSKEISSNQIVGD
jgi:hypothetical protein